MKDEYEVTQAQFEEAVALGHRAVRAGLFFKARAEKAEAALAEAKARIAELEAKYEPQRDGWWPVNIRGFGSHGD